MNTGAKTVFTRPASEEVETPTPYRYFGSFEEAKQFAWELHRADPSLEMSLYAGEEYLQMIPPMHSTHAEEVKRESPTKARLLEFVQAVDCVQRNGGKVNARCAK